jgi:hypothetical protein
MDLTRQRTARQFQGRARRPQQNDRRAAGPIVGRNHLQLEAQVRIFEVSLHGTSVEETRPENEIVSRKHSASLP